MPMFQLENLNLYTRNEFGLIDYYLNELKSTTKQIMSELAVGVNGTLEVLIELKRTSYC